VIKLHELNGLTRGWVEALPDNEQAKVLDLATDVMITMEQRNCRARLGENGSVELVLKTILFCNSYQKMGIISERGTTHE
jgi:hypothetical protein